VLAFIEGELEDLGPPAVIRGGGLGYEVWIPERHRLRLPPPGEVVRLYTHLQVREDGITVYGFPTREEREVFRGLITVSGVGPKVALSILGEEGADGVLGAIRDGNPVPLLRVKGIGRKTAERLVLELKDKAQAWHAPAQRAPAAEVGSLESEAALLLEAMGLAPEAAQKAVAAAAASDAPENVQDLVRLALRRAAP
jgi:Holliday junction DNA helicase RuvA